MTQFSSFTSYDELIKFAQSQHRFKSRDQYFELHHIVPRKMGGTDDESNLVLLTLAEHVRAHYLLALQYGEGTTEYYINICAAHMVFATKNKRYLSAKLKQLSIEEFLAQHDCDEMIAEIKRGHKDSISFFRKLDRELVWSHENNQLPMLYSEDERSKLRQANRTFLYDCPICHKPNSRSNFACCAKHQLEYIKQLKAQQHSACSDRVKQYWTNPEVAERMKNGISKARRGKPVNKAWMTNGVDSAQVNFEDVETKTAEGWHKGRLITEEQRQKCRDGWTPESKQRVSDSYEGTTYICNDTTFCKRVKNEQLDDWLSKGWRLGKNYSLVTVHSGYKQNRSCKRVWIRRGTESIMVPESELVDRARDGWIKGRYCSDEVKRKISETKLAQFRVRN